MEAPQFKLDRYYSVKEKLKAEKSTKVSGLLERHVSCACLREDGSCAEDENTGCLAWLDWDENARQFGDAAQLFCKLPKEERDK